MTAAELAADPAGLSRQELDRLVGGAHHDPHSVLGMHPVRLADPAPPADRPSGPVAAPGAAGPAAIDTATTAGAAAVAAPRPNGPAAPETAAPEAAAPESGPLEAGADPEPPAAEVGRLVVRTLRPEASRVAVILGDHRAELDRVHPGGVFAGLVPGPPGDYSSR